MVEHCRYLGITISTKNSDLDIKRQMRKIHVNANLLLRKFSTLLKIKLYIYGESLAAAGCQMLALNLRPAMVTVK